MRCDGTATHLAEKTVRQTLVTRAFGVAGRLQLQLHWTTAHVPSSTVASFRTWQVSGLPIAWLAAFNALGRDCFENRRPACLAWTPVSGFRATGHRCLPILYGVSSIEAERANVNSPHHGIHNVHKVARSVQLALLQLRQCDVEAGALAFGHGDLARPWQVATQLKVDFMNAFLETADCAWSDKARGLAIYSD